MKSSILTIASILGAAGLAVGGGAYAALYPTSQIFGRVLIAGDDPRELALTYDDGPNTAATPRLLDVLATHDIKATFFLIGRFVRQEPALTREIAAAGHRIGNHTTTHPRLVFQTASRIRDEIQQTNSILEDTLGVPIGLFRPPHGARRPYVIQAARDLGLSTVQWNVSASDWNPIGAKAIARNVELGIARNQRRNRGSNILLHDGGHRGVGADRDATIAATRSILSAHAQDRFVTVDVWNRTGSPLRPLETLRSGEQLR